jgi:hypothetical protein
MLTMLVASSFFVSSFNTDPAVLKETVDCYSQSCVSVMQDISAKQVYLDQNGSEIYSAEYCEIFYQNHDKVKLKEIYDELMQKYPDLSLLERNPPESAMGYVDCIIKILQSNVQDQKAIASYHQRIGDLGLQAFKSIKERIKVQPLNASNQKIFSIFQASWLMHAALDEYLMQYSNHTLDPTYKFITVCEKSNDSVIQAMVCVADAQWQGKPCLEVRALVSAPWNLPEHPAIADQVNRVKGAGTAAIAFCVEESLKRGFEGRIYLQAQPTAIDFYKKLGFQEQAPDAAAECQRMAKMLLESAECQRTIPMLLESLDTLRQRVSLNSYTSTMDQFTSLNKRSDLSVSAMKN